MKRLRTKALFLVTCMSLGACVAANETTYKECEANSEAFRKKCGAKYRTLEDRIRKESADARCSADAQCKTVGIGAKICGGPAVYVAYSTTSTDEQRLLADVEQYNALSAIATTQLSREKGLVSDCAVANDPGAACIEKRCQLRPAASPK